jgi:hypothetical protein
MKPQAKIALILIALVIGFFTFKHFRPTAPDVAGTAATSATTPAAPGATVTPATAAAVLAAPTAADFGKKFTFFPDQPENGQLKGVIEFGASGFNAFGVEVDKQKRWKPVVKQFDESHALEGQASPTEVKAQLKKYIKVLMDHGVAGKNIQFVLSSGAKMNPNTYVVTTELKKMGYVINAVTATQEGQQGLLATQPQSYADKSFVVDIGSGNTKISWKENGQIKSLESFGAKYFEKGISDATVAADIAAKVQQVPAAQRQVCFLIGGVPFKLANEVREGQERYTTLAAPEKYDGKGDQKRISGLVVYKSIVQASGTKQFVFDWESNFTIGYLLAR